MSLTTAGKNIALDALSVTQMSLHTDDPTDAGTANEATGGSPAYSRKACSFNAASAGSAALANTVTFDLPAGSYSHYALWAGATCVDKGALASTKVLAEQGQVDVTAGSVSLT